MSSKDQEILRLQAELARLQAECTMLEELNRKREEELKQLEAAKSKITTLETAGQKMQDKIDHMQSVIDSLQNMMAWFRKKMFGSMSEKNLPLDPSVLEPTLFDMSLSEEEQAALDAEVKKMEEQNAKAIEVKSHKREVRKPVMRKDLPVEESRFKNRRIKRKVLLAHRAEHLLAEPCHHVLEAVDYRLHMVNLILHLLACCLQSCYLGFGSLKLLELFLSLAIEFFKHCTFCLKSRKFRLKTQYFLIL